MTVDAAAGPGAVAPSRRRRSRARRALIGVCCCLLLLLAAAGGGLLWVEHRLIGQMHRVHGVFDGLEDRPPRSSSGPAADAVNILLLGTDRSSRVGPPGTSPEALPWLPGAPRIDSMMVVHLDGDRHGATVISLPLASSVEVPGHGTDTMQAALSLAGPSLAVETVESLTGARIDHLAVIDWGAFRQLTDAIGGVRVTVPRTVFDAARGITWTAGEHLLDGEQALAYVGQQHGLPGGDLDRLRRQQVYLRTLMEDSLHAEMRHSPRMVFDFLDIVTSNLSVDDQWSTTSMARLTFSLRNLRSADIRFLTAPVLGPDHAEDPRVVHLDSEQNRTLWTAVREDRLDAWAADHRDRLTPTVVN